MPTTLGAILVDVRLALGETTASYWTDAELLSIMNKGIRDLWKGIVDLYQDHMITVDTTTMSVAAGATVVSNVPADLFRIKRIQPRTLGGSSSSQGLIFKNATVNDPRFVQAQALPPQSPRQRVIWYAVLNAGAPVGPPIISLAPGLASAVDLAVWYVPVVPTKTVMDANPIPGESDQALVAWTIGWARAKERQDRAPDPEYISLYATEKRNLLVVLTPRSEQDLPVVDAMWQDADDAVGEFD